MNVVYFIEASAIMCGEIMSVVVGLNVAINEVRVREKVSECVSG